MKILKKTEKKIVYMMDNFSVISEDFINNLNWPDGINVQMFFFRNPINGESEVLPKIKSQRLVGLGYSYNIKKVTYNKIRLPDAMSSVKLSQEKLAVLYRKTQKKFYTLWKTELGENYMKETEMVIKNYLSNSSSLVIYKNSNPVALITKMQWKGCLDEPADWITWVWIDSQLSDEERFIIHNYIFNWINENFTIKIQCFVNSFNIRSQKFFRKMGFIPEWLHIVKTK
jgi:hypothetical protein